MQFPVCSIRGPKRLLQVYRHNINERTPPRGSVKLPLPETGRATRTFEFAQIGGTDFYCARGGVDDRAAPP
jgi:hypothetical protein